jgi:hypothetical protein
MTFELNFYMLPTEVGILIMAISIFLIFDRTILFSSRELSDDVGRGMRHYYIIII